MFIPAVVSLLVSTIFLNLGLVFGGRFLANENIIADKAGFVLGDSEYGADKIMAKVAEEVKSIPLPQFPQFKELSSGLPRSIEKESVFKIVNFDLAAENGAILDCRSHDLIFEKRPDRPWPIASITKLFTAYVFLDYNPGWDVIYEMKASDKREGGKIYLFTGDRVKIKDLFYSALVGSDNTAAAALVSSTGMSEEEFIGKVNEKIKNLGLKNTIIVDAAGLKDGNVSTAREIAIFANVALKSEEINQASLSKKYEFATEQGRKKVISSTNELLNIFPEQDISILGGKTGHINASGYCLVSKFRNSSGKDIVAVVLGANSEAGRFSETKKLVDLYYRGNQ